MPAFLEKLTEHIYANHADGLGNISIVLPNRRAILYIKNHLSQIIKGTTFIPEFYSIEDFVYQCTRLVSSDQLGDQFRLFAIHNELEGKNARSIENFFPFASWMLSDFNEIDMHLVDKDKLYGYLTDTRALTVWNPDGRALSDLEQQYLGFYRSLKTYYVRLNEQLSSEGLAYQGGAFRQLAENIEENATHWPWSMTYFAGFNALTPSEDRIISSLVKEGKAEVIWDADRYYLDNDDQEAGYFLRQYQKSPGKGKQLWIEDNFASGKDLHIVGAPGNTGQLKYAGEILSRIMEERGNLDGTALVLSDESLLLPMLNSIPGQAGKFNVTMGLALNQTPLFSLLDSFISMHRNADRFQELGARRQRTYYRKDLIQLCRHPWFSMLLPADSGETHEDLSDKIRNSKRIFFPPTEIPALLGKPGTELIDFFPEEFNPGSFPALLNNILDRMRRSFIALNETGDHDHHLELEYVFRFRGLVQRLLDLMEHYKSIQTSKTFQLIFKQLSQQERIAFRGEPLAGLQVMGMLETRTLDFDTVIILSVNEGVLPATRLPNSFIPFDIKNEKEFTLPTFRHNNRVFAYHFYRLLQRSSKAYLLYNTESDVLGGGEKSRFITQLQHEGPKYSEKIRISEEVLSIAPPAGYRDTGISVEKDKWVMKLLRQEAEHGFHPSSLSKYIACPLQFYLARIARVEDTEEVEETIDARMLGIVAHESLQTLFKPYLGIPLRKEILNELKQQVDKEVDRQFAQHFHAEEISYGKNYLVVRVARHMLKQFLTRESEWLVDGIDTVLIDLEKPLKTLYDIPGTGKTKFRGTADRIDKIGSQVRIIDYKTGSVKEQKLKWGDWEPLFEDPDYSQAFQLMMYSWLYSREHPAAVLSAGIISLKMPGNGPVTAKPEGKDSISDQSLKEFESRLIKLIRQIFDPAIPFSQTEDENQCRYCSFKEVCNKSTGKTEY